MICMCRQCHSCNLLVQKRHNEMDMGKIGSLDSDTFPEKDYPGSPRCRFEVQLRRRDSWGGFWQRTRLELQPRAQKGSIEFSGWLILTVLACSLTARK